MNRIQHPPAPAADIGALLDVATRRAHCVRQHAIDAFWDDTAAAAARQMRAAQRFAARLARHQRLRGGVQA